MFLKVKKRGNKSYLSFVESYWDGGTSRHRTVFSLGELGDFSKTSLKSIGAGFLKLGGISSELLNVDKAEVLKTYNWGACAVVRKLWTQLNLDHVLNEAFEDSRVKFNTNEAVFNIVLNRLTHPESKLKLHSRQDEIVGIHKFDLHHYYKVLDIISKNKEKVEELMFKNSNKPFSKTVDIVLYDVTTLYFESTDSDELRKKGWNKDGKASKVQVVVGLTVDKDGRPLSFDVFPGNKYEGHTLISALTKLRSKFNVDKVIVVADRGINNRENLGEIRNAGFDYVLGHRFKNTDEPLQDSILDLKKYTTITTDSDGSTRLSVREILLNKKREEILLKDNEGNEIPPEDREKTDSRIICSWSASRAYKDMRDREKYIEKAKYFIENPHKLEDKKGCKKYLKIVTDDGEIGREDEDQNESKSNKLKKAKKKSIKYAELNLEQIEKDTMYDGIYTIETSDTTLTSEEVLTAYKHLWKIEESFRVLKSSLDARPIYHWTPDRIVGHLMCCYIALTVERALENILTKKGIEHSVDKIRDAINKLSVSEVKLADGEPEIYLHQSLKSDEYKLSKDILKALGIDIPKSSMTKEQFKATYEK